jgi:hypothetical protein
MAGTRAAHHRRLFQMAAWKQSVFTAYEKGCRRKGV